MSKYKTEIEDLIWEYNTSGKDLETAMLREIGHVYSQASKADEYEVKAEAFDEVIEILKELRDFSKQTEPHSQRMKVKRRNYVQFCDEVLREIKLSYEEITDEYESGESE